MTFPDLSQPESILPGMQLLKKEYPGAFKVDGRGQSGGAGLVRQWAGAGLRRAAHSGDPENTIVWMHMGLSRELVDMDALQHTSTMAALLDRYPNLMLDISWRGIDDLYFSDPSKKRFYVAFLNDYSERVLPGTDFLASRDKDIDVYRTELRITSGILRDLNDTAFRNIGCN